MLVPKEKKDIVMDDLCGLNKRKAITIIERMLLAT